MSRASPTGIKKSSIQAAERAERRARGALNLRPGTVEPRSSTYDSFQNFALQTGIGTDNALSQSTYGFNPITRNRVMLEWMYRGSWITGMVTNAMAEDMTKAGIDINATVKPEESDEIQNLIRETGTWSVMSDVIAWARLYGGAIGVIAIDGQHPEQPLRPDRVGRDQYKGLIAFDRWMVEPTLEDLVSEPGPYYGTPRYYKVRSDAPGMRGAKIHYSRCIRMLGIKLPYWQAVMENLWGISVLERMFDRIVAFDSATMGAAQLVFKAYLRVLSVEGLKEIAATGGEPYRGLLLYTEMMRRFQSNEGVTLIDGKDKFEGVSQSVGSGVAEVLVTLGQQISGSSGIPLVRLFGQSPAGLNSTGENDMRMHYDNVNQQQDKTMKPGVSTIVHCAAASKGIKIPKGFGFSFRPLWQLTDEQKSQVFQRDAETISALEEKALIDAPTALRELRQQSSITGRGTNITDEMIENAESAPAPEPDSDQPHPDKEGEDGGADRKEAKDHDIPLGEIAGIQYVVECRAGQRRWNDGPVQTANYGYVRRVGSAEGATEWLDCLVGRQRDAPDAFVIDQYGVSGFDEHKVMLGFRSQADAVRCWQQCYRGVKGVRLGDVTQLSTDALKTWMRDGDVTQPMAKQRIAA